MKTLLAILGGLTVAGLIAAAFLALLWPRAAARHVGAERDKAISAIAPESGVGSKEAGRSESNKRDVSLHSRVVAAANAAPSTSARPSNEEILARLRAGEQPMLEPEDILDPQRFDSFEDPSLERDVGLWPADPEEIIARLRAGDLPPLRDFVEGPPGKPRLREGTPKMEVLEAWGTPVHVFPAHTDERPPHHKTLPPGLVPPFETDHLEYLEEWVYSPQSGPNQKSWHFDGDRLTARAYSVESYRAVLIEHATQIILARKRLE